MVGSADIPKKAHRFSKDVHDHVPTFTVFGERYVKADDYARLLILLGYVPTHFLARSADALAVAEEIDQELARAAKVPE